MKCKSCKEEINKEFLYCPWCGTQQKKSRISIPTPKKMSFGYTAQIMVNGQRVRVTGKSIKEYEEKCIALKSELVAMSDGSGNTTLGKAIDKLIADKEAVLSPSTVASYKRMRKDRFKDYMDKPLKSINYQKMISDEKDVSAKTITMALSLCRSAAKAVGFTIPEVTLPQRIKPEKAFLDPTEIKVLLNACKGTRSELYILLGLHSLRNSEILAVKKENIHDGTIDVFGSAVFDEHHNLIYKETNKTSNSRRSIPILIKRLGELIENAPDGYLIGLTQRQAYKDINKLCEDNNLPLIGCHGLRHSFCSLALSMNPPLTMEAIKKLGGWDDVNTIQSIYGKHISDRQLKESAEQMQAFFDEQLVSN